MQMMESEPRSCSILGRYYTTEVYQTFILKILKAGWGFSSVTLYLPQKCKALSSIPWGGGCALKTFKGNYIFPFDPT